MSNIPYISPRNITSLLLLRHRHLERVDGIDDLHSDFEGSERLDRLIQLESGRGELDLQLLLRGLGDVLLRDGGIELAGLRGLLREADFLIGDLRGGTALELLLQFLFLRAPLDLLGVASAHRGGGDECFVLREEAIQGVAVPDEQEVVLLSDAGDVLKQNDFHEAKCSDDKCAFLLRSRSILSAVPGRVKGQ